MSLSPMDFCNLCDKFDGVQTYIRVRRGKKDFFIHICEDCYNKYDSSAKIVDVYLKRRSLG